MKPGGGDDYHHPSSKLEGRSVRFVGLLSRSSDGAGRDGAEA